MMIYVLSWVPTLEAWWLPIGLVMLALLGLKTMIKGGDH